MLQPGHVLLPQLCTSAAMPVPSPACVRVHASRGAGEIKMHPWFKGMDFMDLARSKAAFVPTVDDELDTSYFEAKHVSQRSMAEDLDRLR